MAPSSWSSSAHAPGQSQRGGAACARLWACASGTRRIRLSAGAALRAGAGSFCGRRAIVRLPRGRRRPWTPTTFWTCTPASTRSSLPCPCAKCAPFSLLLFTQLGIQGTRARASCGRALGSLDSRRLSWFSRFATLFAPLVTIVPGSVWAPCGPRRCGSVPSAGCQEQQGEVCRSRLHHHRRGICAIDRARHPGAFRALGQSTRP